MVKVKMKMKMKYFVAFLAFALLSLWKVKYVKILLIILLGWIINLFDPMLTNDNGRKFLVNNSPNILHDLTIIIPSCDKYSELWEPNFQFLLKNWPSIQNKHAFIPIYLISNFKEYKHSRVTNIRLGEDISWSDNFIKALDSVKTKYLLIILEDYIIDKPVNEERLIQIMHLMENTEAAYVELSLDPALSDGIEEPKLPGVIVKSRMAESRTSLQASLWNVGDLKKILEPQESAWDFEIISSFRSRLLTNKFYLVTKDPVFQYQNAAEKGRLRRSVINYINKQNISFAPVFLPIDESL